MCDYDGFYDDLWDDEIDEKEDGWDRPDDDDYEVAYWDDGYDSYLAAWDPEANRPAWWLCRECNGMGSDPYGTLCARCGGSAVRWPWLHPIIDWWFAVKVSTDRSLGFRRCPGCGKLDLVLGIPVGKHSKCLPF